jgi:hypothetical protein
MDAEDSVNEAIRDILRTLGCPTTTSYVDLVRYGKEEDSMEIIANNGMVMWPAEIKEEV